MTSLDFHFISLAADIVKLVLIVKTKVDADEQWQSGENLSDYDRSVAWTHSIKPDAPKTRMMPLCCSNSFRFAGKVMQRTKLFEWLQQNYLQTLSSSVYDAFVMILCRVKISLWNETSSLSWVSSYSRVFAGWSCMIVVVIISCVCCERNVRIVTIVTIFIVVT